MPRDCIVEIKIDGAFGHAELIETRAAKKRGPVSCENESSRG